MIKKLIDPLLRRPDAIQCAALVYRRGRTGIQILVITSREAKRWIIPKGWPMAGKTLTEAARIEAWEEAGLKNVIGDPIEIGTYRYEKYNSGGVPVPITVFIHAFETDQLEKKFPEKGQRKRKWVSPKRAQKILKNAEISAAIDRLIDRV